MVTRRCESLSFKLWLHGAPGQVEILPDPCGAREVLPRELAESEASILPLDAPRSALGVSCAVAFKKGRPLHAGSAFAAV